MLSRFKEVITEELNRTKKELWEEMMKELTNVINRLKEEMKRDMMK